MNERELLMLIEQDCACDAVLLDGAIHRGIDRARNERIDGKKLARLFILCVAVAAISVTINLRPMREKATAYVAKNSILAQESSKLLQSYMKDISETIILRLGGN